MRYGKKRKKIFWSSCIFMLLLCGMSMMGCSFRNPILGTWKHSCGDGSSMTFYKDGTWMFTNETEIMSYKQQKDGTLILTGTVKQMAFQRTDNEEQAHEDARYYYLSKDTFIIFGNSYYQDVPIWENVLPLFFGGMVVLGGIIILLYWKRDGSRPLMTKKVKILEKPTQWTNAEWYIVECENGERLKLKSFQTKHIVIAVGDIGIIEYRGKTIQSFQRQG